MADLTPAMDYSHLIPHSSLSRQVEQHMANSCVRKSYYDQWKTKPMYTEQIKIMNLQKLKRGEGGIILGCKGGINGAVVGFLKMYLENACNLLCLYS